MLHVLIAFVDARSRPGPIQKLRVRTFDTFQVLDPRLRPQGPVTIIDIDERSLADPRLGQWPWRARVSPIWSPL